MRLDVLAVTIVVVLAFAVPTAAMTTGRGDQVGEAVKLAPHSGPNGEYASIQNGKLQVDFERLNDEARTKADNVFTISANGDEPVRLTVASDEAKVEAYSGTGRSISPGNPVRIQPGQQLAVGFRIDTLGPHPDESTITITARPVTEDSGDEPGSGDEDGDDEMPAEEEDASAEVLFADGPADGSDVTVEVLDTLPVDVDPFLPEAIIEPGAFVGDDSGFTLFNGFLVTDVGRSVTLTGRYSYIGEAEAIARDLRVSAILDIRTAPERRDQPATVRIRVPRGRLDEPGQAAIARHTSRGWQILPTAVDGVSDRAVTLSAETPGFSTFAVFARSDVDYEWTLPDGSTVSGPELDTSFAAPGRYNVSLTVTDAMGRSDSAERMVIANDRPTVEIVGAENADSDEEATIRANVTNEVGNTTVTWTLPDGSVQEGQNVTGTFDAGDPIQATVEDEYGASDTAEAIIGVGAPQGQGPLAGIDFLPSTLPWWVLATLVLTSVMLAVLAARSEIARVLGEIVSDGLDSLRAIIDRLNGDAPRITAFDDPRWDPLEDCVEIGRLAVEAPSGFLKAVEITITDEVGRQVIQQSIDAEGEATFDESPVRIPVYGGVELSETGRYTVEVRAIDEFDRIGVVGQTHDIIPGQPTASSGD